MRSSRPSPSPDPRPDEGMRRLDLAYLAVLPPVLVLLKLPMLLFLLAAVVMIRSGRTYGPLAQGVLFGAGAVAIFLSMYGSLNMVGLSRLSLFLELLLDLLLVAVALQRISSRINLYLLLSPALLLALTLFFHQSVAMLLYLVLVLFLLFWFALSHSMRLSLRRALPTAARYYLMALPAVALLFLLFPRISFGHGAFGFRGDGEARPGLDGTMRLDGGALRHLSRRIVMEVGFEGRPPPSDALYFRGSVLYVDRIDHWAPLPPSLPRAVSPTPVARPPMYSEAKAPIRYTVALYPTRKRWLYLLDLPLRAPDKARIDADFCVTLPDPVEEPRRYEAVSALRFRYGTLLAPEVLAQALRANPARNPRSALAAQKIRQAYPDPAKRLAAIERFFQKADLTYTLSPPPFDLQHATDDFLFRKKEGYCVHFAAAFATFCRLARLPARIVTGYKPDGSNRVAAYLAVEERDAHAWVEVRIQKAWRRIETTALASRIAGDALTRALRTERAAPNSQHPQNTSLTDRMRLYLLYAKFRIESWILRYSHYRQLRLLERFRTDLPFALRFAAVTAVLVLILWALQHRLRRPASRHPAQSLMRPLLRRLRRRCPRRRGETVRHYLARCRKNLPPPLAEALWHIDRLYHDLLYGEQAARRPELKKAVADFLRRFRL